MSTNKNLATVSTNPFRMERHFHEWTQGETVADILRSVQPNPELWRGAHVYLNDIEVSPEFYHVVRPKPCLITIKIAPADSGLLRTIALIALTVAAVAITGPGGFFGAAGLGGWQAAAVGAAIVAVGSIAINALIPIDIPQLDNGERRSQALAVGAARNRINPFGVLPVVLGTYRVTPPYAARPFTQLIGDQQYAVMLFALGMKDLEVDRDSIQLGNTPISSYADEPGDVLIEMVTGGSDDDDDGITLYKDTVFEEVVGQVIPGGSEAGEAQAATAPNTQRVDFTIEFPFGIIKYDKNDNGKDPRTVIVTVQYSDSPTGNWTNLSATNSNIYMTSPGKYTFTAQTVQPIRAGFEWTPPSEGQWHIKMRADVKNQEGKDSTLVFTKRVFGILRSWRDESPVIDPTCALVAIKIRATDQLNGIPDQVSMLCTSILPVWSGGNWNTSEPTNNNGSIARYLLTGDCNARALDPSRLETQSFGDFYDYCVTNSLTYNQVIDYNVTIHQSLNSVCRAAFSRPLQIDGQWTIFTDQIQTIDRQVFTPRNSWGFSGSKVFPEKVDAFRCRYISEVDGLYQNSEQIVYADGKNATNSSIFEALEVIGITNWDQVFKYARRYLAISILQPETFTLTVDPEHLVTTVGDRVGYADDCILVALGAARVKVIDNLTVTLDASVPMEPNVDGYYAVQFRLSDGTVVVHPVETIITADGFTDTLTFFPPLGDAPAAPGDLAVFGVYERITIPMLIKNIEPTSDLNANLTLIPYSDGIYSSDTERIPDYDPVITTPPGAGAPVITQIQSNEYVMYRDSGGTLVPRMLCTLAFINNRTNVQGVIIQFRVYSDNQFNAVPWESLSILPADTGLFAITGITTGQRIQVRGRFTFRDGTSGEWSLYYDFENNTPYHTVIGTTTPPPAVDDYFVVVVQASGLREYQWGYKPTTLLPPDMDGFRIKFWDTDLVDPGATPVDYGLIGGDEFGLISAGDTYALQYSDANPDWAAMTPLTLGRIYHEPFEYNSPYSGGYIFAIVAVDVAGIESLPRYSIRYDLPPPQLGNSLFYIDHSAVRWLEGDEPGVYENIPPDFQVAPLTGFLQAIVDNTWTTQATWDGLNGTWQGNLPGNFDYTHEPGVIDFDSLYLSDIRLQSKLSGGGAGTYTFWWSVDGGGNSVTDAGWTQFNDGDTIDLTTLFPAGINTMEFRLRAINVPAEGLYNWVVEGYASAG